MFDKYYVAMAKPTTFPSRSEILNRAWGNMPVSYIGEFYPLRSFVPGYQILDAKVNKWELNEAWSMDGYIEPSVRINACKPSEFLAEKLDDLSALRDAHTECVILSFEIDEGALHIDRLLMLRLLLAFVENQNAKIYSQEFQTVSPSFASSVPTREEIIAKVTTGPIE